MHMQKTAVVFGGTGFIGRQIVKALAQKGLRVIVPSRAPESAYELKPMGDVGQISAVPVDLSDYNAIADLIKNADYVVNTIGILYERKKGAFTKIHAQLPESIATACSVAHVERFVHVSALGADAAESEYAKSKLDGEQRVLKNYPNATILRPSIVFGPDDNFFNRFAQMAQILPVLPLIGGGKTKFQPVYVGDVVQAVMKALFTPQSAPDTPLGQIYELGGPETLTFKDIYGRLFSYTNTPRPLLSMPFWVAKLQAAFMPNFILTGDQVDSLKTDNIVQKGAKTLADLGITPTATATILPNYLTFYRPGGRFAQS